MDVCINYWEGLEWVYTYYNSECPNWRWKYNYHYPPLFNDLCKFIPNDGVTLIPNSKNGPVSPYVQLSYVLPYSNLHLLPEKIAAEIRKNHLHFYPLHEYEFKWAFCRYFWEAHPVLPEIPLISLERIVKSVSL